MIKINTDLMEREKGTLYVTSACVLARYPLPQTRVYDYDWGVVETPA